MFSEIKKRFIGGNRVSADEIKTIIWWLLESRFIIVLLQMASNLLPDHDADAFKITRDITNTTVADTTVKFMFDGLSRWDALYFLYIAEHSYTMEQLFAFFPLYPTVVRIAAWLPSLFLTYHSALLVTGVLLNIALFTVAGIYLFLLTVEQFRDMQFSREVLKWFCCNPASIFFTACYSESLFAATTFGGLYHLKKQQFLLAGLLFACASLTRSNGLINVGYLGYAVLIQLFLAYRKFEPIKPQKLLWVLLAAMLATAPFVAFQRFSFTRLCHDGTNLACCKSFMPLLYSCVQAKYWNIGLFQFYQLKQIPNFLLATPVISIVAYGSWLFSKTFFTWETFMVRHQSSQRLEILPFVIHAAFLIVFGLLFMHVHVITRMICSSTPLVYWIVASLRKEQTVLKLYFYSYFVIGTVLHSNFFPWT